LVARRSSPKRRAVSEWDIEAGAAKDWFSAGQAADTAVNRGVLGFMSFPVESIAGVRHTQFSQEYQSKGVAGKGVCKSMKTKGRGKTGPSEEC
jgi:hypothetical protein